MECREIILQIDDLLDARLSAAARTAVSAHLQHCVACRRHADRETALRRALRTMPTPALRAGFAEQALARAARKPAHDGQRARGMKISLALAATLVLGIALGLLLATQPTQPPVQTVALTLEQPETIRLVFHSAKPLTAATLSLQLPDNVELVGYRGQRTLNWQTDLREGANQLQLPLLARGQVSGELVAHLSHGESSRTFRINIKVKGIEGDVS